MSIGFTERVMCLFAVLLIFSAGCSKPAKKVASPPGVIVTPAVRQDVIASFQIVGQVVADSDVDFRARVEGFLEKRNFKEGQFVKKNDLLFVIEKSQYEAKYAMAKADVMRQKAALDKTSLDYERQKTLYEKKAVSKQVFDNATYEKASAAAQELSAEASLKDAELQLSYTEIRAPFDGRIGLATYSVGNLVGPSSSTLANIVKVDPIKVQFNVSESAIVTAIQYFNKNKERYKLIPKLILPNGTPYDLSGSIEFWSNKVNSSTGTILMQAAFKNPTGILIPGQYVKVILERNDKVTAILIPKSAIQQDQTGDFAMVVGKDNIVKTRPVKTGDKYGVNIVIESGLKEGERVITEGLQKVRPNMKVSPVLNEPYETESENRNKAAKSKPANEKASPEKKKAQDSKSSKQGK